MARSKKIDYPFPYIYGYYGLILPLNEKQQLDFWAYVNMFNPHAWFGALFVLVLVASGFVLIKWLSWENLHEENDSEVQRTFKEI